MTGGSIPDFIKGPTFVPRRLRSADNGIRSPEGLSINPLWCSPPSNHRRNVPPPIPKRSNTFHTPSRLRTERRSGSRGSPGIITPPGRGDPSPSPTNTLGSDAIFKQPHSRHHKPRLVPVLPPHPPRRRGIFHQRELRTLQDDRAGF